MLAHHVANLAPFLGATAAAAFLYEYRLPFMLVRLGVNATAITISLRRLAQVTRHSHQEIEDACTVG